MTTLSSTANRIDLSVGKSIIPLLVILCIVLGYSVLLSPELTLAVFISIAVFIAMFIEPLSGAMFYLICLYVRPFEILPIPRNIPVMKILALFTLATWLLNILVYRKKTFVKAPQNLLLVFFLAALMASHRGYVHGVLDAFSEFSKIVIIYFLLVNLIANERRLKTASWILILCTTYLAVQGILLSRGIAVGNISLYQDRVVSTGIFGDPNDLAMSLIVGLPFVFYLFFFERFVLKKMILVASGSLILYCILLTGSRGGMLGLAVVVYLLLRRKTGTIVGIVLALVCLFGLLFIAPSSSMERFTEASLTEETGHSRIEHWYHGWQMFLSNPITGVGMGNYPEYANGFVAHNSFVHVAAEIGIVGISIWIGLFYFAFKNLMAIKRKTDKAERVSFDLTLADSLKASLTGFIVCGFSLSRQYQYIPYILIALSVSTYHISSGRDGSMRISIRDAVNILGITFGFIVSWYMILRMFT